MNKLLLLLLLLFIFVAFIYFLNTIEGFELNMNTNTTNNMDYKYLEPVNESNKMDYDMAEKATLALYTGLINRETDENQKKNIQAYIDNNIKKTKDSPVVKNFMQMFNKYVGEYIIKNEAAPQLKIVKDYMKNVENTSFYKDLPESARKFATEVTTNNIPNNQLYKANEYGIEAGLPSIFTDEYQGKLWSKDGIDGIKCPSSGTRYIKPEEYPDEIKGFEFIDSPCDPCKSNFTCKWSMNGHIAPLFAAIWGTNSDSEPASVESQLNVSKTSFPILSESKKTEAEVKKEDANVDKAEADAKKADAEAKKAEIDAERAQVELENSKKSVYEKVFG